MTNTINSVHASFPRRLRALFAGVVCLVSAGAFAQSTYTSPFAFITLAGAAGEPGSADGTGPGARFSVPGFLATDAAGNVYMSDTRTETIRKVTPAGVVTTLAGTTGVIGSADGQGPAAQFNLPAGLAVDGAGNVYVADSQNDTIRKITPGGAVTTFAGAAGQAGSADGPALAARFNGPAGVAVDAAGNVFVADTENFTVREISASGTVTTLAGTAGIPGSADGTGAAARFDETASVALDPAGNLYVADSDNFTIRKVTASGVVTTLAGSPGQSGTADGAGAAARFQLAGFLAVDGTGTVYAVDSFADTVRKITPAGQVSTVAGGPDQSGSADGTGAAVRFNTPVGVALDSTGNLYVADSANSTLRVGRPDAWLSNLSARADVQGGQNLLIAGFVTAGPAAKSVLVRGDGPALAAFGIPTFLPDPQLSLLNATGATLSTAVSWDPSLSATFTDVGAFPLMPGSHDTAMLQSLTQGAYTAQIGSSSSDKGVAIAEVYDADQGAPFNRLINLSARALVGTNSDILIGGFVIGGTSSERVLIRGDGPALSGFGITGALANPVLTVLNSAGATIATNSGWGNPVVAGAGAVTSGPGTTTLQSATAATFGLVGAFNLAAGSADSAMVVTLPPGAYTAQVAGAANGTGVGLVEIYELY